VRACEKFITTPNEREVELENISSFAGNFLYRQDLQNIEDSLLTYLRG
jgi:hypothetical protein